MAEDFAVRGTDDFYRLSKALKHAGRTGMRKELHKGLQRAAKPLIPKTRREALHRLPRRGGLAQQVAREPQRVQVRTGATTAGVRVVVGKKRGGARAANQGRIRHRVFGQDVWVEQRVTPGWFDDTVRGDAPEIRRDLERVVEDFAKQVVREARR
jgi:hypothetical protein